MRLSHCMSLKDPFDQTIIRIRKFELQPLSWKTGGLHFKLFQNVRLLDIHQGVLIKQWTDFLLFWFLYDALFLIDIEWVVVQYIWAKENRGLSILEGRVLL